MFHVAHQKGADMRRKRDYANVRSIVFPEGWEDTWDEIVVIAARRKTTIGHIVLAALCEYSARNSLETRAQKKRRALYAPAS